MAQSTMRGMRLGAQSLEAESGIVSERSDYVYICAEKHETKLTFAAEAELPQTWQCKACSLQATLQNAEGGDVTLEANEDKSPRTHWEMVLERRTREELEEILARD